MPGSTARREGGHVLRKVRGWNELPIGREIVFISEGNRFKYRIEARSPENDMVMVSIAKPHWKKRR